jgi:acetyltransferase
MNKIQVRRAGPGDAGELARMVSELSTASAHMRFFAGVGTPSARLVAAMLRRDGTHGAWVCADAERLVGHAMWGCDGGAAEIGVVVADSWQRHGLGRSLMAAVLTEAARTGLTDVRLYVHAENRWLARRLSSGGVRATLEGGVVTVTRPLSDLLDQVSPTARHSLVA